MEEGKAHVHERTACNLQGRRGHRERGRGKKKSGTWNLQDGNESETSVLSAMTWRVRGG